jgi:hypothetical protein
LRPAEAITLEGFLSDRHGKTFADVANDPATPFVEVIAFFNDAERQQRMEDSEIHHDRAPLAGVVRELESAPNIQRFFATLHRRRSARLRQAIGVLVRMIMERRSWQTTGKKGSLGVRGSADARSSYCNTGGLALWFIRAERYRLDGGMPFRSVRERYEELGVDEVPDSPRANRTAPRTPGRAKP